MDYQWGIFKRMTVLGGSISHPWLRQLICEGGQNLKQLKQLKQLKLLNQLSWGGRGGGGRTLRLKPQNKTVIVVRAVEAVKAV